VSDLMNRLNAFVGVEVQAAAPARDAVNTPMIRHWCDAMQDANPVYTDPALAATSLHGGLVAPPTMLQAWTMRGLVPRPAPGADSSMGVFEVLDAAGFTSVVATNCRQEYARYLRPGDELSVSVSISAVSEEKKTGLGVGHFVTQRHTFIDQNGESVGTMEFRILKFKPQPQPQPQRPGVGDAKTDAPRRKRPRPSMNDDTAFFWKGLEQGRLLVLRCAGCGVLRHPPEPMCPSCNAMDWQEVECSGRGSIYSYVVAHHPPVPPFAYPNPIALVELEEGVRLVANLKGIAADAVEIGMPVEAVFEPVAADDDLVVPLFQPRRAG
jgi:uncharacterized OB-fold protein/acyl dehydratase